VTEREVLRWSFLFGRGAVGEERRERETRGGGGDSPPLALSHTQKQFSRHTQSVTHTHNPNELALAQSHTLTDKAKPTQKFFFFVRRELSPLRAPPTAQQPSTRARAALSSCPKTQDGESLG
jgi:hypothetical protein